MRGTVDTGAAVALHERSLGTIDPIAWDLFVVTSGGSFLGSWKVIRAEGLLRTVRVFELFSAGTAPVKIGQCAIAVSRRRVRFLDRLHLLPEHAAVWAEAVQMVVARCGAATYAYGSPWNHECRRVATLAEHSSDRGLVDAGLRLDCVDFAAWPDFASYRRAVSENIRRDYKKAAAAGPTVVTRRGVAAYRDVPALVGLRKQVMERNGEPFSSVLDTPKHALKLLCLRDDAFISTVEARGERQGAFFGVRFGDRIYFLSGGTRDRSEGFGSYLFLSLIEGWFSQHPGGKLYLGMTEPGLEPATYDRGNLLYRRKLRATSVPGTAFTLDVR
ncbi:MAG: GNAT family N-acetyltransferase [Vicinamibacteraceae bacterium]